MTTEDALDEESDGNQSEADDAQGEVDQADNEGEEETAEEDASRGDSTGGEAGGLYERLEELGAGGVGTVWRARHTRLNRDVALKEVNQIFNVFADLSRQDVIDRFVEAVQAQATLVHPNVVQILDVDTDEDFPFVVSQYAPLGSLRRVIDAEPGPGLGVALKYFTQMLSGLDAAHRGGLVHGNLKPENVVLDASGNAMLSDFGLSDLVERDEDASAHVYVGVGTVAYMSPEQFQNPQAATVRSDIYSLGIMFYEMLAGKVPGRRSPMPSQVAPGIPERLDDIFDKMSRDEPEARYESADQILSDLYGSAEIVALLDVRAPALFYRDPVEHGELGGIIDEDFEPVAADPHDASRESSSSLEVAEPVAADISSVGDEDYEQTAVADAGLAESQPALDTSSDVQPAADPVVDQTAEPVGQGAAGEGSAGAGDDAEVAGDDVLDKLDKYGELFEE
ncbi:MAG: serine/threonine-protein kinase [Persicimonas sp.]